MPNFIATTLNFMHAIPKRSRVVPNGIPVTTKH